ncbi:unnamed protein product [Arabis nemorensis]|uniref:Uncharacterized protein n=1 Tax=Arabis nemorensis TaxID=586526 RepID=A0A565AZK1_9BRAS|nr:unnamed protein product [Arabis nemorensis]
MNLSSNDQLVQGHGKAKGWSTDLCECWMDINSCCLTCWCPCVAFGRIAEIVDRGSTSCGMSGAMYMVIMMLTGFAGSSLYSCFYRTKLRAQHNLKERPCCDCCVHFCCEPCALCQEYRQLQQNGAFDLSIGWHGNMEKQARAAASAVPPSLQPPMSRLMN